MELNHSSAMGGSLQISVDVLRKIAKMATLEIDGVAQVSSGTAGVHSLLRKTVLERPVTVQLTDDVAEITVSIVVKYGCKIPTLCEKVQDNVKACVQNMTNITVSRVNVVVANIAQELPVEE